MDDVGAVTSSSSSSSPGGAAASYPSVFHNYPLLSALIAFALAQATKLFTTCLQVMHDAFSVRLHAGRQAEVLNQIVFELPMEHPLANTRPLRELLGHTPLQVIAGAVLGFVTATIAHLINRAGS